MLKVAVLIDHPLENSGGGLTQCWKNLAKAASVFASELHLDLHFLGKRNQKEAQAPNVTFFTHPPLFGTNHIFFLKGIPDQADLAPLNPWLLHSLSKEKYDLIHTTNAFFGFAKTGLFFSRLAKKPLTNSIQTDLPSYTKLYTEKILKNLLKSGRLAEFMAQKKYQSSLKKLQRYLLKCNQVISFRRGIDKETFHPQQRNPNKLKRLLDINPNSFILLFVGRIDEGKSVMTLVEAAQILLQKGSPIHVLMIGQGSLTEKIKTMLGKNVTCTGVLPHNELGFYYASSDLFVFPSQIEIFPNVVIEAKASGLPVLMAKAGGASQVIKQPGRDGIVLEGRDPSAWAKEIAELLVSQERWLTLSQSARAHIEKEWPSWEEVLQNDLWYVWRKNFNFNSPSR